jgi:hypothetical protein
VPTVEEELLTLLGHLGSLPVFGEALGALLLSFLCCLRPVSCDVVCPMLPVSLDCLFLIIIFKVYERNVHFVVVFYFYFYFLFCLFVCFVIVWLCLFFFVCVNFVP